MIFTKPFWLGDFYLYKYLVQNKCTNKILRSGIFTIQIFAPFVQKFYFFRTTKEFFSIFRFREAILHTA